VSSQPKHPAADTDAAYDSAEEIRAAANQVLELVSEARMRPDNFADAYAAFDDGDLLTQVREEMDALLCWLEPAIRDLDRRYIRRLPPEERDELPAFYVAGANGR
jgi:hypothetical protein